MILAILRSCALAALLAGLAAPSLAAAPAERSTPDRQRADAVRARRVELPFPLDVRPLDRAPAAPVRREEAGPHPFRETLLKRASLAEEPAIRLRLSRPAIFG